MLMTIEELRRHVATDQTDDVLTDWLLGVEASIKRHTDNDFQRVLDKNGGQYPADIKMGVVNLFKWEQQSRPKVSKGIQSETISRHSVTYTPVDGKNTEMGFPQSLLGFLEPYECPRFGEGVDLWTALTET